MASIDRLNMLIRNYNERFPNATVEQMGNYLRRNHPEEYKLFQRIGDVKQNIVNHNFTLGEGSALKYQNKPATNLPVKTATGANVVPYNNFDPMAVGRQQAELERIAQEQAAQAERKARMKKAYEWMEETKEKPKQSKVTFNPQPQLKAKNPPVRWEDRFQPPAKRDNTNYTKGPKSQWGRNWGGVKTGVGAGITGMMGAAGLYNALTGDGTLRDKALDVVSGVGGLLSTAAMFPHPIAKIIGYTGMGAGAIAPIVKGALNAKDNQEVVNPMQQQAQAQPVMQQPTQQVVEAAPQIQRVTNAPTEYQLPNINITTQTPQATGDFYNRADIMQKELGAMTRGAAQNFNQVQAGPTPEQIQAYANILNLRGLQQDQKLDDIKQLEQAKREDDKLNKLGMVANMFSNLENQNNPLPTLTYRDWSGNVIGQYDPRQGSPNRVATPYVPTNKNVTQAQQQIALNEQVRQQELANAQEMAKLQDAIALANATGMPINQALSLTGEDVLGYNKDVIQRQSELLGKGIEGGYDIAQKAIEQEGSLAKEGYSQAGQNARTAANIQRDILKTQMDNAAAMDRILQQGQNALSLAEYKARTGTTEGYPDYLKSMLSVSWMFPEDMQMAVWQEAMKRQGIIPTINDGGGYYQTDGVIDL